MSEERIVPMRLQRFLARSGVASRRGSENLMTAGRVRVNGEVVTELGSRVDPLTDEVRVDDIVVHYQDAPTTIMLHKPAGYVTTMSDPQGRHTVSELVPREQFPGLYPLGRLDTDTTGLLLFSTDGALGNGLLHPSHHVDKSYLALVEGTPTKAELDKLRAGIMLDDGMTAPASVEVLSGKDHPCACRAMQLTLPFSPGKLRLLKTPAGRKGEMSLCRISLHEGRNRQVKRMFGAIGHPVIALHRDTFGPLSLGTLSQGSWRKLTDSELDQLNKLVSGC